MKLSRKEQARIRAKEYRAKRDAQINKEIPFTPQEARPYTEDDLDLSEKKIFNTTFICGHRNKFIEPAPKPDDFQWCYRCMDYQLVVKVNQEYQIRRQ